MSPKLQRALQPLLAAIKSLNRRIRGVQRTDRKTGQREQSAGGAVEAGQGLRTLIALTFLLTTEDARRFRKSRDVGSDLGLQPGRRNSGQSEPQMHISNQGDPYLRTLLVHGVQHILGLFGADSDLRRWACDWPSAAARAARIEP